MAGPLALVGGDEFLPGNEPQDLELVRAAAGRPAYIVTTAAARQDPARSFATARAWFQGLGVEVRQMAVHTRTQARSPAFVDAASGAGMFYLAGGDPGLVPAVFAGTPVWEAVVAAWRAGAALAGSSAGSMALCEWTLVRERWPDRFNRRYRPGLGLVPGSVVLPHWEDLGSRWVDSATAGMPRPGVHLIGVEERSAALWDGDGWRASGRGRCHLVVGGEGIALEPGSRIPHLPRPLTEDPGCDGADGRAHGRTHHDVTGEVVPQVHPGDAHPARGQE